MKRYLRARCLQPLTAAQAGISYLAVSASDDAAFRILDTCLAAASQFITAAHARGVGVLVHCMAGVNRFLIYVDAIPLRKVSANISQIGDARNRAHSCHRTKVRPHPNMIARIIVTIVFQTAVASCRRVHHCPPSHLAGALFSGFPVVFFVMRLSIHAE